MKQILIIALALLTFQSCTTSTSTSMPNLAEYKTIQCQAYKVTVPGNDTSYLQDLNTYMMQTVEPDYYETQWGIKTYSWGYTFCDCWVKP